MADKITLDRMDELLRVVFRKLKEDGGQAKAKDALAAVESKGNLNDYEKERTKSGAVRWSTHIRFYTVDCVKAGYLVKADGQWVLTQEGEKALTLPPGQLIRSACRKAKPVQVGPPIEDVSEDVVEQQAAYEEAKEGARAEIDEQINNLGPYEFQKLVAELLRAMGYYVAQIAPPGPDGGVDIVAYKDPLGTVSPRINVQVKHREQKVDVTEVRQLVGILHKEGDIGLIASSGGFTKDAEREIRSSTKHIEKMDLDRLVNLWQEHYERISESGKALLPLVKLYFLKPTEE